MFVLLALFSVLVSSNIRLFDGSKVDHFQLGFGTWNLENVEESMRHALNVGYRHIDCASGYENQEQVGNVLSEYFMKNAINRRDLWITSKASHTVDPKNVIPQLKKTLEDLQCDYLDLLVIHWPCHSIQSGENKGKKLGCGMDLNIGLWKALEKAHDMGLTRYIGVSNFSPYKMSEILKIARKPIAFNQVELHPFLAQFDVRAWSHRHNILVTAYSPLGSPGFVKKNHDRNTILLKDPVILAISRESGCTPGQVLIKWSLMNNVFVIPKSSNPKRILENFEAQYCKLTDKQRMRIDDLDRNFRVLDGSWFMENDDDDVDDIIWDLGKVVEEGRDEL